MRLILITFFALLQQNLKAQIFADFVTSSGNFTVELDYENSPRTVANFLILAEGSRPWIDSNTGQVVSNTPFYEGINFHRVVAGFVIQAGSPNGMGTDGPGYVFPDEIENDLIFDQPYLLAMANSGPNTNGSQFFITTGTPTFLNGVHTIFGNVSTGTAVVDLINSTPTTNEAPNSDITINSVTIRREGSAAESFDEFAQDLPIVSAPELDFQFPGPIFQFQQPPNSTCFLSRSTDLINWDLTSEQRYLDANQAAASSYSLSEASNSNREFFSLSLVSWASDATPILDFSNIIITQADPFYGTFTMTFSPTLNEISIFGTTRTLTDIQVASDLYRTRVFANFSTPIFIDLPDNFLDLPNGSEAAFTAINYTTGYTLETFSPLSGRGGGNITTFSRLPGETQFVSDLFRTISGDFTSEVPE